MAATLAFSACARLRAARRACCARQRGVQAATDTSRASSADTTIAVFRTE